MPMFKWTEKKTGKIVQRIVPTRRNARTMSVAMVSADEDEMKSLRIFNETG